MHIAWDRQAYDMENCHRRELIKGQELVCELVDELNLTKERLQASQKRVRELERENFQLKTRRK